MARTTPPSARNAGSETRPVQGTATAMRAKSGGSVLPRISPGCGLYVYEERESGENRRTHGAPHDPHRSTEESDARAAMCRGGSHAVTGGAPADSQLYRAAARAAVDSGRRQAKREAGEAAQTDTAHGLDSGLSLDLNAEAAHSDQSHHCAKAQMSIRLGASGRLKLVGISSG